MNRIAQPKGVVSAVIEREQCDELERRAAESDRTISWLVRQAVEPLPRARPQRGRSKRMTDHSFAG
jgi:hypothetical protein